MVSATHPFPVELYSLIQNEIENLDFGELLESERLPGGESAQGIFFLKFACKQCVLRILDSEDKAETKEVRTHELLYHTLAAEHRLAPEIFYQDANHRFLIMEFIEGEPMKKNSLSNETILELALTIKKLHSIAIPKISRKSDRIQEWFDEIYKSALEKGITFPSKFDDYCNFFLKNKDPPLEGDVLCHRDLHFGNLIRGQNAIYLVDWETAAAASCYDDLGYFTYLSGMSEQQEKLFLESYFGYPLTEDKKQKLRCAKAKVAFYNAMIAINSLNPQKHHLKTTVEELDRKLEDPSLKLGSEYMRDPSPFLPDQASAEEIQLWALGFYKEFLQLSMLAIPVS